MDIQGKIIVITGGASGIGKAMAERFHKEGAAGIVTADLNGDGAKAVANAQCWRAWAWLATCRMRPISRLW